MTNHSPLWFYLPFVFLLNGAWAFGSHGLKSKGARIAFMATAWLFYTGYMLSESPQHVPSAISTMASLASLIPFALAVLFELRERAGKGP